MGYTFNPFTGKLDYFARTTLDTNADAFLSLTGQELGLDTQTANRVFAGPTSGGAAVPTFRALVAADIPSLSYLTSSSIDDTAYGVSWDGDTTHAPSKNAVYDKIETLGGGHTQNTDVSTTSNTFTIDSDSTTGKIILDVALGASNNSLTLTNAALTGDRTITFPNSTGTMPLLELAQTFTAAQKINVNSTTALFVEQDGVKDNVLVVDTTNGRIGMGTASPVGLLSLRASSPIFNVEASGFSHNFADTAYSHPNSLMTFAPYSGASGGAIFIGINSLTSTPALSFFGTNNTAVGTPVTQAPITFVASKRSGTDTSTMESGDPAIDFNNGTTGWAFGVNLMRIMGSGYVGIGVTPLTTLHVRNQTATTNAILEVSRTEAIVTSSGVAAAGFGVAHDFYGESATNTNYRQMGRVATYWRTATDASRAAVLALSAYDTAERKGIEIEASGSAAMIGFLGATPIVRPSAYTQTYSTADKTHANFTSADISAFTGGSVGFLDAAERDNILTQFNALRADVADLKQLVNSVIDDLQSLGLIG